MSWLGRLFRRPNYERDLEREISHHLDSATADEVRAGRSPDEARRQARMGLGGVEQVKESARDARGTRWVEDLVHDLRYALRSLGRAPAFTAAAVLTLAVGIGANTAVWSVLDRLLIRPLPIEHPEQLHVLRGIRPSEESTGLFSAPALERFQSVMPSASQLIGMTSVARLYTTLDGRPEPVQTQLVTGDWFHLLGVGAQLGRPLGPEDNRALGGGPVAVLSDAYWTRRFGRDPAVLGRSLRIGGAVLTVVGVIEPGFTGVNVGDPVEVWVPFVMQAGVGYQINAWTDDGDTDKPWGPQEGVGWLTLLARIDPASREGLATRLDQRHRIALEQILAGRDSASRVWRLKERLVLEPVPTGLSNLRTRFADPLRALMGSVGLVLLITCANLAGLLLARSLARSHELAIRVSLGARPGRLVRQALTESLLLALFGGGLGVLLAQAGARGLLRLVSGTNAPFEVSLDLRVLLFAMSAALLTGLLFGLAPALRAARTDPHDAFKSGGRVVGDRSARTVPLGRALVVSQIALSLLLVAGAGLFVRTLKHLLAVDPGYDREQIVLARIETRAAGYTTAQLPAVYQRLLEAVSGVPGVRSASLSLKGVATGSRRTSGFVVPGVHRDPSWDSSAEENLVTPGFFATLGIPLLRGRGFSEADAVGPKVIVVSEETAKHFFGTTDVVGRRFGYDEPAEFEIVGVVRDARMNSLREDPPRMVYQPLAQWPQDYAASIEVRAAGSPAALAPSIKAAIEGVDANLPVQEVVTLDDLLGRGLRSERLVAWLAGTFSALALLLVAIGLYGVLAYAVSRRTNEMGVRMALGGQPGAVRWLVLRDALGMVGAGLGLGTVLWFPTAALVRRLVYGLSPHDPTVLLVAGGVLLLAGTIAALLPAWRASRVDPVTALRAE